MPNISSKLNIPLKLNLKCIEALFKYNDPNDPIKVAKTTNPINPNSVATFTPKTN